MPTLSYWESQNLLFNPDILVIGAGIVGLNAAYHARLRFPKAKILVLERGLLPMGASTKNAGFACFGSAGELLDDLENQSETEVFELVKNRYEGLLLLRETLGDQAMEFSPCGGYELFLPEEAEHFRNCYSKLEYLNNQLAGIHGQENTYSEPSYKIDQFGFKQVQSILFNRLEGSIHTGKTMVALWKKCIESNIMVLNGFECLELISSKSGYEIKLQQGLSIHAEQVVVATNAFGKQLIPELEIQPGRAQVLITSPIENLPFSGTFHFDRGYYYFRNVGNRVLFGGGRNLDFEGEQSYDFQLSAIIQNQLEEYLHQVILPGKNFEIEQRWSGIMGLGPNKGTILKKLETGLVVAVRMGGMGVALGSLVGKKASELLN
ncbi:MAG: FAD-binding oxidoreductase [Bacteroidia bacterium]|nr:FAD-binding oxidoreductase [Bacteroidia bacterium]